MIIIICHWLTLFIIDYHWLSLTIIGHLKKHMKKFHTTEASEWKRSTEKENKEMLWFECLSFPPFFEELLNTFYSDLNLVSTAIQRPHLSEFDFYFKVASTFMSTDTFSSTEPQQAKYKRRKLQKDVKRMGPEHASREKILSTVIFLIFVH